PLRCEGSALQCGRDRWGMIVADRLNSGFKFIHYPLTTAIVGLPQLGWMKKMKRSSSKGSRLF
ncbi:hypothetical protein, partial [Serratia fonticola]